LAQVPTTEAPTPWVKICNTDPATQKVLCLVTQELRAENGQFIASATLRQITGEDKIQFIAAVPPGVLIQPGVRVQVDESPQQEVKYGICFPNACYAEMEVNADFITSLKRGNTLNVIALNAQARGLTFPMTLSGFTRAYDGAGIDAEAAQAREEELNSALQRRAEALRQRLREAQGGTTPTAPAAPAPTP
jgi:invasion protein IalB